MKSAWSVAVVRCVRRRVSVLERARDLEAFCAVLAIPENTRSMEEAHIRHDFWCSLPSLWRMVVGC